MFNHLNAIGIRQWTCLNMSDAPHPVMYNNQNSKVSKFHVAPHSVHYLKNTNFIFCVAERLIWHQKIKYDALPLEFQ
jgi:hypothetical protein